tara:strand:- start:535 stop:1524 length:990 start_codon:yes stop_codon:yes gene_type:complete
VSKWASNKKDHLIFENWRRFLKEGPEEVAQFVKASDPRVSATDYVPLLKKIAADPYFRAIASAGQTDAAGPQDEIFEVTPGSVPAHTLHATQAEIGLTNSLSEQLQIPEWAAEKGVNPASNALGLAAKGPIEMLCKDERCAILTFGSSPRRILDGHHRWSQVMMMNPDAEVAIDDVQPTGVLKDVNAALKLMQLAIALKAGRVETLDFEGDNLMKASSDQVEQFVLQNISDGTLQLMVQARKIQNPDAQEAATYIAGNLAGLQKNKGFDEFTRKAVMPQAKDSGTSQTDVNDYLATGAVNFDKPRPEDFKQKAVGDQQQPQAPARGRKR